MTNYSDLVKLLRRGVVIHVYDEHHTLNSSTPLETQAADAIEAQAKRIEELEAARGRIAELEKIWTSRTPIEVVDEMHKRIAELEHQLKFECDTYLWNRKRMSRRIASLQGWMKKLFKYGSSPEAIRNQMTMTTEIPDYLMREGEDLLFETTASDAIGESEK